jgi:hypothetical protein
MLKVLQISNSTRGIPIGVVKKPNFRAIQQKIPQESDFVKKRDSNPVPQGEIAADIAKMFALIFSRKLVFATKNTIFEEIRLNDREFH